MRKYNVGVLFVFVILSLGTVSVAAELQDGFLGYKWGGSISQYAELTGLYAKGDVTYYSNPGESYQLEDITVDDVVFGFFQGSLFAVYVGIDALETYDQVMLHMKLKYGFPDTKTSAKDHLTTLNGNIRMLPSS